MRFSLQERVSLSAGQGSPPARGCTVIFRRRIWCPILLLMSMRLILSVFVKLLRLMMVTLSMMEMVLLGQILSQSDHSDHVETEQFMSIGISNSV